MLRMMAALTKLSWQRQPKMESPVHWSSTMKVYCFLSTISHLLPAWTTSTVLKSTISHPVIPVLAGGAEYYHFGQLKFILPLCHKLLPILPQIATYFASIMPVASRYRLCQLLCRQIRLKPNSYRTIFLLILFAITGC